MTDIFNLIAPFYDHVFKNDNHDKLLEMLDLPTSGNILDAGGGTGRISELLVGEKLFITVADLSIGMLKQAKIKNGLEPICSHIELLPFPERIFNRIMMVDAFHHVCDQYQSIEEMWRVLDYGGVLVIEEPDISAIPIKLIAIMEKALLMRSKFIPPTQIAELFNFKNADVNIFSEGYISWIVVKKGF